MLHDVGGLFFSKTLILQVTPKDFFFEGTFLEIVF